MLRHRTINRWIAVCGVAAAVAAGAYSRPALAQVSFHGEGAGASVKVTSWRDIPFRTVVRQQYDFSCGSAAVATLLTYQYGRKVSEAEVFKAMYAVGDQEKIQKVGFSMLDMKRYLDEHGMKADGFRMSLDEMARRKMPAIVLINLGKYRHFVVIKGVYGGKVLVGDPALGLKIYPKAEFQKMWNGVAFALHDDAVSTPVRFNAAAEWSPWSTAPLSAGVNRNSLIGLTNDQMPLYQVSPIRVIDIASIAAGVPQ